MLNAQHYGGPAENRGARRQNEDALLASRRQVYPVHRVHEEYLGAHRPHNRELLDSGASGEPQRVEGLPLARTTLFRGRIQISHAMY
jgi:hypothetical protein